jgi:Zn-dependent protease
VLDFTNIPERLIAVALILLIGFPVHECAHAWAAYVQGDATAKLFGRLTLNPMAHFDRFGGSMLIISAFAGWIMGWAKPTPYNAANLRHRRNGEVLVALAGPASNLVMAGIAAAIFRVLVAAGPQLPVFVAYVFVYFTFYMVGLGFINLIPIPPFDGSAILLRFLSPRQAWQVRTFTAQYGMMLVLAILIFASPVISSVINRVTFALLGA